MSEFYLDEHSIKRPREVHEFGFCIGKACMAFRVEPICVVLSERDFDALAISLPPTFRSEPETITMFGGKLVFKGHRDKLKASKRIGIPISDQIACIEREMKRRHADFATLVYSGNMSSNLAHKELSEMDAVLDTLKGLRTNGFPTEVPE